MFGRILSPFSSASAPKAQTEPTLCERKIASATNSVRPHPDARPSDFWDKPIDATRDAAKHRSQQLRVIRAALLGSPSQVATPANPAPPVSLCACKPTTLLSMIEEGLSERTQDGIDRKSESLRTWIAELKERATLRRIYIHQSGHSGSTSCPDYPRGRSGIVSPPVNQHHAAYACSKSPSLS
ncbi:MULTISPECIES: hypothetical protein [Dyella]|uniref:Uncharacterized protein n=2 Tax=Dyella TaxID=231454 RepID=A0A4R0YH05_9GAMM|nr:MULTISPECIES: hypothetical protein [Dyella]TBR37220.1 hypothetical protein EYV96_15175 [Dyella terrae]TCI07690.1 hypothetical protein EZM97_23695 [Dyella soli]